MPGENSTKKRIIHIYIIVGKTQNSGIITIVTSVFMKGYDSRWRVSLLVEAQGFNILPDR